MVGRGPGRPTRLVVHIESPHAGPGAGAQGDVVYRTLQPCRALGELPGVQVVSGSLICPGLLELARHADLVVLCDVVDVDLAPLLEDRRRGQRPTVYEINDDFLSPQPWSPSAYLARNWVTRSLSPWLASHADAVQFTTTELERRHGGLNARRAVFRNHLWDLPPIRAARASQPVRVGWGGSIGHREDLRALMPTLARVLANHPEAILAVMADRSVHDVCTGLPAAQLELVPAGTLADYYAFVGTLDVGLAPLLPTDFNRCRSDVKFLEYAAHQVVPVCAALEPYQDQVRVGQTGFLFGDDQPLEPLLDRLIAEPSLRLRVQEDARRYVAAQRLERPRASERWAFYQPLLGPDAPASAAAAGASPPMPDDVHGGEAYRAMGDGEVERHMHQGLLAQRDGDVASARTWFERAIRLNPTFAAAHLQRGACEPDAQDAMAALGEAAALDPRSVAAPLLMGDRARGAGDAATASRHYQRAAAVAPGLGLAEERLGELARDAGDWEQATRLFVQSFASNPFYATPAVRLAERAMSIGEAGEGERTLREAIERDDRLPATRQLLGRVLVEQGRFAEARPHLQVAVERSSESATDPRGALALLAKAELGLGHVDAARAILNELQRTRP